MDGGKEHFHKRLLRVPIMILICSLWVPHTGGSMSKDKSIGENMDPDYLEKLEFCYTMDTGNSINSWQMRKLTFRNIK